MEEIGRPLDREDQRQVSLLRRGRGRPRGDKALELWTAQRDDLLAGRKLRVTGDRLTVGRLCNRFLEAKDQQLSHTWPPCSVYLAALLSRLANTWASQLS